MAARPVEAGRYEHDVAITGLGRSRFGARLERTWISLAVEACGHALRDADLSGQDIDGVCVHGGSAGLPGLSAGGVRGLAYAMGLMPTWHDGSTESPGRLGSLIPALLAISAGLCQHVLLLDVCGFGDQSRPWLDHTRAAAAAYLATGGYDREVLGWVAISARKHAERNPDALLGRTLRMDDYLSAETIFSPFSALDLAGPCQGATALIISARELVGAGHRPVLIDALASGHSEDLGDAPSDASARATAERLWDRASVTPSEIELALLDDRCTFDVLGQLETLGLCAPGHAAELAMDAKRIGPEGDLPVNPDGGRLAMGHAGGYGQLYEAVLQLRGEAGARQIPGANVAAVSSLGAGSSMAMLMTRAPSPPRPARRRIVRPNDER
ncbi:MAG: thiolase family protein [Acidimicrobiales bacterium]|nr:thiolase family protein [Acidimicrobiales bacterium]